MIMIVAFPFPNMAAARRPSPAAARLIEQMKCTVP